MLIVRVRASGCRTGLAGSRTDRLGIAAGAFTSAVDGAFQGSDGIGGDVRRDRLLGLLFMLVERDLTIVVDLLDDVPVGLFATGGDGRVGIGHVNRRHGRIAKRGRENGFDAADHR